jgi:hypothetical protein
VSTLVTNSRDDAQFSFFEPVEHRGGRMKCVRGDVAVLHRHLERGVVQLAMALRKRLPLTVDVRFVLFAHLPRDEQIIHREMTSDFQAQNFWERALDTLNSLDAWHRSEFVYVTPATLSATEHKVVRAEFDRLSGTRWRDVSNEQRVLSRPFPMNVNIRKYVASDMSGGYEMRPSFDVGIISVVSEEVQAAVDALRRHPGWREKTGNVSGRIFYEGQIPSSDGLNSVVCVQQLEQGNRSTALAYEALRQDYDVALAALVGIGGSIHKDMKLCDVAIADSVFYYDKRKIESAGTKHRGEGYKIPAWMKQRINHFFMEHFLVSRPTSRLQWVHLTRHSKCSKDQSEAERPWWDFETPRSARGYLRSMTKRWRWKLSRVASCRHFMKNSCGVVRRMQS